MGNRILCNLKVIYNNSLFKDVWEKKKCWGKIYVWCLYSCSPAIKTEDQELFSRANLRWLIGWFLKQKNVFIIEPSLLDKFSQLPLRLLPGVQDAPGVSSSQYLHWYCRNPQASHHPLACGGAVWCLPPALHPVHCVRMHSPSGTGEQASIFVMGCESSCKNKC